MSDHPTIRAIARMLPGIVAASLAIVYVVGSINAAGAFARDGLSVTAVRLLTLEQLLVRGVSVMTQPGLLFSGLILVSMGVIFFRFLNIRNMVRLGNAMRKRGGAKALDILVSAWVLAGFGLLLLSPWRLTITASLMLLAWVIVAVIVRQGPLELRRRRLGIGMVVVSVVGFGVANYFVGFPQPLVEIDTKGVNQPLVTGVFVTHTDGVWYVAEESNDNSVQSIPDRDLTNARLIYRTEETSPSIATLIWNGLP